MDSSYFSHLMVLISIILGLGITGIFSSIGAILRNRDRIRLHFPLSMWVLLVSLTVVQFWWTVWGFSQASLTFLTYVLIVMVTIAHYLLTRVVLPDFASPDVVAEFSADGGYRLESYYLRNAFRMSGVAMMTILLIMVTDAWVFGTGEASTFKDKLLHRSIFLALLGVVAMTGLGERRRVEAEARASKEEPVYRFAPKVLWIHGICTLLFAVALVSFIVEHSLDTPGKRYSPAAAAVAASAPALVGAPPGVTASTP